MSWYENLSVKNKARLARVVNQADKIVGTKQLQLCDLYQQALSNDSTHPFNSAFETLPSGRRLRMPLAHKNCYKISFIPSAISILNSSA